MTPEFVAVALVIFLPAVIVLGVLAVVGLVVAGLAGVADRASDPDERTLLRGLVRG